MRERENASDDYRKIHRKEMRIQQIMIEEAERTVGIAPTRRVQADFYEIKAEAYIKFGLNEQGLIFQAIAEEFRSQAIALNGGTLPEIPEFDGDLYKNN